MDNYYGQIQPLILKKMLINNRSYGNFIGFVIVNTNSHLVNYSLKIFIFFTLPNKSIY